jgi:hypothetical protein
MVVRDTHPGLISRKLFEAAKAAMATRGNGAAKENGGRPVGGWSGARSRFILSGLVRCAACGGRYQGVTRTKGRPRPDSPRIRTYSYACGSYIAKGTSACSYNPIGQEKLESEVIEAVLKHFASYSGKDGLERLTAAVQESLGIESKDIAEARRRLDADRRKVEGRIAGLLDHVTSRNRDMVEERLDQLRRERAALDTRREELELLATRQAAVQDQVRELGRFLDGLEFTLRHGTNVEKMAALRRCVESVKVEQTGQTKVQVRAAWEEGPRLPPRGACRR